MSFSSETTIKQLAEVFKIAHPWSVGSSVVRTSCSVRLQNGAVSATSVSTASVRL